MTLARSFSPIPNISRTTLLGCIDASRSRCSFFTHKSWKSGLIDYYRGVRTQVALFCGSTCEGSDMRPASSFPN